MSYVSSADEVQKELDSIICDVLRTANIEEAHLFKRIKGLTERLKTPKLQSFPRKPEMIDERYNPTVPLACKIFRRKMKQFREKNCALFAEDSRKWNATAQRIRYENQAIIERNNSIATVLAERSAEIERVFNGAKAGISELVTDYILLRLRDIKIPPYLGTTHEVFYDSDSKILLVDLFLPSIDKIPTLKSTTYIQSRSVFKNSYYPESYIKKKYESVVYSIVVAYIAFIFRASGTRKTVESVVINGKVKSFDKATGLAICPCVLSVNVSREEFRKLNLYHIDAKAWFKSAKGISAASLSNITPVAPVLKINKRDKRIIDGYSVVSQTNEGVNLASMDWKDFENLIREIFEYEFLSSGGEVKITQASRDGGVDAIAFDPDPIRGGKIVIQAKRYTNTVGVSAVRDLYGTVLNEGAIKGILVTTSNYGNDAYAFAQGKPLTLLNGANLLYLMEKHGHRAYIDLREAKALAKEP